MRVLFVKQDHASPSGLVGDAFTSLGWDVSELIVVPEPRYHSPNVPVDFPPAATFDALVFYGAPWSVYDTQAIGTWIGDEIAFDHVLGDPRGRDYDRFRLPDGPGH